MNLNGRERTPELLKEMQSLPLSRKIQISQARIIEFYNRMNGNVYISFSGGKDSCVLLHLVRTVFPEVKGVFSNTGLEFPEIVDFVKTVDNIDIIRPEKTFKQVIEECGFLYPSKETSSFICDLKLGKQWALKKESKNSLRYQMAVKYLPLLNAPFKVSDKCCGIMKKKPLLKYQREHNVQPFVGLLAYESELRATNWVRYGCNSFSKNKAKSAPLSFWLEEDIINYLDMYKVPYCDKLYGKIKLGKFVGGTVNRTGCIFYLAGIHASPNCRFKILKLTHPHLWHYCMKSKEDGGLGMQEVLDWINTHIEHKYLPMDYGQNDLDFS